MRQLSFVFCMLLVSACAAPGGFKDDIYIGTDGAQYLATTLETEDSFINQASGGSSSEEDLSASGSSRGDERVEYDLTRTLSAGVRRTWVQPLSGNLGSELSVAIEAGLREYSLPEGVLLSNGTTRLTDPIDLTFTYLGLRPEALLVYSTPLAGMNVSLGAGGGLAVQSVKVKARSALLDIEESQTSSVPYGLLRTTAQISDIPIMLEATSWWTYNSQNGASARLRFPF